MSLATLITEPITAAMGFAVTDVSAMRFVVQIAGAPSNAVLGTMILGTSPLTDLVWTDVTDDVHGAQIKRGAQAGSRPGAGQLTFRLQNRTGQYHPYRSTYYGPGTLVRVALSAPGIPDCLVTALTINWQEASDANLNTKWIDVVALETIALLGEVNNVAQAAAGAGENISARVDRILTAAGWQLGPAYFAMNSPTPAHALWGLQSTTLAANALAELYLSADSVGMVVRAHRNGTIIVASADFVPGTGAADNAVLGTMILGAYALTDLGATFNIDGPTGVPTVRNSIVTANDDDRLLDHISVARVGGAQVTYTNTGLAGRWQNRSSKRTDLITQNPGADEDLARYASLALAKGRDPYRVEQFQIDTAHGIAVWAFLRLLDIGTRCYISRRDTPTETVRFNNYPVCGYTLNVIPQNETTVRIRGTVETDVGLASSWELI